MEMKELHGGGRNDDEARRSEIRSSGLRANHINKGERGRVRWAKEIKGVSHALYSPEERRGEPLRDSETRDAGASGMRR